MTSGDLDRLEPLLSAYPFKPYRQYRVYSRKAQTAIMRTELQSAVEASPSLTCAASDGGHEAVVIARALPWDSNFFGVKMARVDYVVSAPKRPALADQALDATFEACRAAGIPHLTARVDVEDIDTVARLERRGFRLMDALVTYRTRPRKDTVHDVRDVGVIRDLEPTDAEAILDIARESFAGYAGRFQRDPHVPDDRAEAFYLEWAKACLSGQMADKVLVSAHANGQAIGFLSFRRREPASTVGGATIFGGGLGACRRDSPGAYPGLIRAGIHWAHGHGGVAECQTQNYNFAVIRVYEAAGMSYVRAEYTLHAWLE